MQPRNRVHIYVRCRSVKPVYNIICPSNFELMYMCITWARSRYKSIVVPLKMREKRFQHGRLLAPFCVARPKKLHRSNMYFSPAIATDFLCAVGGCFLVGERQKPGVCDFSIQHKRGGDACCGE